MNVLNRGAVLGALALVAIAGVSSPASAASPATEVLLDNLIPNVDFLDRSSRFALTNSRSARVREFAFNEAKEQTIAANSLYEWTQARTNVLVASTADPNTLFTGRSVATDGQTSVVADTRLPKSQEDLDSLEGLDGTSFDVEYRARQLDALNQIQSDYQDYIAKGDDPVLLGIASRELPKVRRRIALLGKL